MARPTDFSDPVPIQLDYSGAEGIGDVLRNLSGIVAAGDRLWSVSDEGRSLECLAREGDMYRLTNQIRLDDWFPGLPKGHEADLESLDLADGRLWLCGSHCRVRRKPDRDGALDHRLRSRHSRHLLGSIPTGGSGKARALPEKGRGSLRKALSKDRFIGDFVHLPSKENGLDIEGLAVMDGRLFLGLRGPVIDSFAMVLEIPLSGKGRPKLDGMRRHFLWLGGCGVRDLAADGGRLLVVAGPVTATEGPFTLHAWRPGSRDLPVAPERIAGWDRDDENPEGICRLDRNGVPGLLVVYDSPGEDRIEGTRYRADWVPMPG